jgi:hypothetical protein
MMSKTLTARDKAIDAAMLAMYGSHGPDADINADAVRRILGAVFDAGAKAKDAR